MTHHNLALYTSHDANVAWRSHDNAYHVLELERITGQRYYSLDTDPQWASQFSHAARWFSRRDPYLCLFPNDDVRQWMLGAGDRICGHHDAHAACAFYQSPFDEALVLSYDGGGPDIDGRVVHFAVYKASRANGLERLYVADNLDLGTRYRDAAGYVPEVATPGSNPMTWPGKSMALAAFGEPTRFEEAIGYLQGVVKPDPSQNDANWLASVQAALERIVIVVCEQWTFEPYHPNVCLTGGCALNVKVNQRLHDFGYNVYVPPNPSDCGLSLGMLLWQDRPSKSVNVLFNGHDYLSNVLAPTDVSSTLKEVATLLAQGKVVGFVHGRPEVGPRALGHRSILAADIPGMRDRLNCIKGRASYRPVAPMARSVHVYALFDLPHSATMSFAPRARYKGGSVHVDGTSRLQCVTEADNPLMWELLTYYEATSPTLPLLLNTSLNQRGRPLVGSLSSAFSCLQDLDALYVNGTLHKR